jgi:hypothetical protein
LMDPAVLAALARPSPDPVARHGIHQVRSEIFKSLRAFAWMMAR